MPLLALPALRASLTKDQRLIGIDPGSKTIGIALSDVRLMLASPFGSVKRGKLKANAADILAIARKENAGGLVVGLPLSMDGSAGPAAQAARDWALALSEATGLPAALFDERLSSAAANRFLISEADVSHRKRAESGRSVGGELDAAGGVGCQPDGRPIDQVTPRSARWIAHPAPRSPDAVSAARATIVRPAQGGFPCDKRRTWG